MKSRIFAPNHVGLIPYKSILALKTIAQKVIDLTAYDNIPVLVTGLDENWERQRAQIAGGVTIIGTTGTPTLGPARGAFEDGDGFMPSAQLDLPGAKTLRLGGPHNTPLAHLWQVQYSGVVNAAMGALG